MKKKSFWSKFLIWLLVTIISIFVTLGMLSFSIYKKHKVNVFKLIGQVKTLNEEVDLNRIVSNAFSEQDLAKAKLMADTNLSGLITYSAQNGYKVNFDNVQNNMKGDLRFTDKEVGAIIDTIIKNNPETKYDSNTEDEQDGLDLKIMQVSFLNITETTLDFNVVMKIDLVEIKDAMTDFPFTLLRKIVPDDLYFSSTVSVAKGSNAFEYTTTGKSLVFNNLSESETDHIMRAIAAIADNDVPSAQQTAYNVGSSFVNLLIGNETNTGIAYALKDAGATGFSFETDGTNNYFVIER